VTAVCNTSMCSAAYWIGAQARDVVITPAGEIGSLGVIGTHMDESQLYQDAGLVVTYVRSVPGKALGQSTEAMAGEVLDEWQSQVDRLHTLFVEAVARGRGRTAEDVRANWATGAVWFGAEAIPAGLADRVGTLSDVVTGHLQEAARQQAHQGRDARRAADPAYGQFSARVRQLEDGAARALPPQASALNVQAQGLYAELDAACLAAIDPVTFDDYADLRGRTAEAQHTTATVARTAPPQEEDPMKMITLTAADGTTHEVENTPEAIQAFLATQASAQTQATATQVADAAQAATTAAQGAHAAHLTHLGALFGLTPEQATGSDLEPWQGAANRAAAVSDYRAALLTELEALAVTVDGNTGAAAQIVKLAGQASLTDLQGTVTAYRERRDALVPQGRQSQVPVTGSEGGEAPKKAVKTRYDRN
ncbi:S49 family peptidase, partial [Deinococcus sp.]|uniref:S49 family peptidase n=1 Tax=Deinococcus sp. TaxID=47478 RepID=UPI002869902B